MKEGNTKIVQIATAAPVGGMAAHSNKPMLFGLTEDGDVYVYNWLEQKWDDLRDIDE